MKKHVRIIAMGLIGCAIGVTVFFAVRGVKLRGQTIPALQPFTATMVDYHYAPNQSQPAFLEYSTLAMKSDGSQATVHRRELKTNDNWYDMRTILNLTGHQRIAVDPITQSTTTYPLSPGAVRLYLGWETNCAADTQAEISTMLGYRVVRVSSNVPGPHGSSARETWKAPGLGCLALKDTWSRTDPRTGASYTYRLIQVLTIIEGEPSATLFSVPADYVERSPSQVLALAAQIGHGADHPKTDSALDSV